MKFKRFITSLIIITSFSLIIAQTDFKWTPINAPYQILNNYNGPILAGTFNKPGDIKLESPLQIIEKGKVLEGRLDINKPLQFLVALYDAKPNQTISMYFITFRRPNNERGDTPFYLELRSDGKLVPQLGKGRTLGLACKEGDKSCVTKVGNYSLKNNVTLAEIQGPKPVQYNLANVSSAVIKNWPSYLAAINLIDSKKSDSEVIKELDNLFKKNNNLLKETGAEVLKYVETKRKSLSKYINEQIRKNK